MHAALSLPGEDIRERYFRYPKTLVKAGDSRDPATLSSTVFVPVGSRFELVPENDPYVDDELVLTLLFEGDPVDGMQVKLFERTPDDVVSRITDTTDADGRVRFDVGRAGDYLVNAVNVREPGTDRLPGEMAPPHWKSHWASLTFERPR